jgi:GNAT superfamily N-acetyltransferase
VTDLRIVPANEASCWDLQTVFGVRGSAAVCQCQRYKLAPREAFSRFPASERRDRLEAQTHCGDPTATTTTGLIAYLGDDPVGWVAVEPRVNYPGLLRVYRVPWQDRSEDKHDPCVWSVTCVFIRAGFRGRGFTRQLVRAAADHARARGARAVEGYPFHVDDGQEITWDEIHVGARSMFADAGFREVSRPGVRRVVMRIDFGSSDRE